MEGTGARESVEPLVLYGWCVGAMLTEGRHQRRPFIARERSSGGLERLKECWGLEPPFRAALVARAVKLPQGSQQGPGRIPAHLQGERER
jgi:hypothetical protein